MSEITMDWQSGMVAGPSVETSTKTLGQLRPLFHDQKVAAAMPAELELYRVQAYMPVASGTEGGLFLGNTVLQPGKVGDEYFMTRGHFHRVRNRAEYYLTFHGEGALLLMNEAGATRYEPMSPGSVHYIPRATAHRVANIGSVPLVFAACWPADAGYDYETIDREGFSARLLERDGRPVLVPRDSAQRGSARMIGNSFLNVSLDPGELSFRYGAGVSGPATEFRRLDAIRANLLDPNCDGPDPVYGIAMDVARAPDMPLLKERMLLYGMVAYAPGRLGEEPVRSQGHVHAVAPHSGWSPPEIFEVLEGSAIIYAQRTAEDDPGECVAVTANPGDKVVVPPGWAHCVINADPARTMVFGAWCDRQYGFVYEGVRRHRGLAWFPVLASEDKIEWRANPAYRNSNLDIRAAREYPELGLVSDSSLYLQYLESPESVLWVCDPATKQSVWRDFQP